MPLNPDEEAEYQALLKEQSERQSDLTDRLDQIGVPLTDFLKRAALPTAAGAAGVAIGSRLPGVGPAMTRAAVPLLESGLSAGGEALNQIFDITPDDPMAIALAGGAPPVFRGVAAAGRGLIASGRLPGSMGGVAEMLAESAPQLVAKVRPTTHPDVAWEQAKAFAPVVPAGNFAKTIGALRTNEELIREVPSLQYGGLLKLLDELETTVDPVSQTINLQKFEPLRKRLGEWSRSLKGPEQGAYRKLYGSILDDLESSAKQVWIDPATQPAVEAIKVAMSATRRDLAGDALEESISKAIFTRADGITTFRANQVLNDLRRSKGMEAYRKAITKGDLSKAEDQDVLDTLKAVTRYGSVPPGRGQQYGSGAPLQKSGFWFGAIMATQLVDIKTAGAIVAAGNGAAWLLSKALMTPSGRAYVKAVAKGGGHWRPETLGLLANVIRAATVGENEVDASELPPLPGQEVTLPPVYDILPPNVDTSQLPRTP